PTAYVGFTGASGPQPDQFGAQTVKTWRYQAIPPGSANRPPVIVRSARLVSVSSDGRMWELEARAADDGGPLNLRTHWERVSGPSPSAALPQVDWQGRTTVRFDLPGSYTYRFVATDAQGLTATSDVTYVVS